MHRYSAVWNRPDNADGARHECKAPETCPRQVAQRLRRVQESTSQSNDTFLSPEAWVELTPWLQCDETRPACGACLRLDTNCLYPATATAGKRPPRSSGSGRSQQPHAATSTVDSPSPLTPYHGTPTSHAANEEPDAQFNHTALDMELMAEALLNEAEHFPCDQLTARDYARNLARLAIATPYLMHEMLALHGLRLFAKDTSRRDLMARALFHQSEALRLVQQHLIAAAQEHALALFLFTSYAAVCALAEPALCGIHNDSPDPLEKMLHGFQLSRGIVLIVDPYWSELRQTWVWPVVRSQIEAGSDLVPRAQDVPNYTYLRCLAFGLENESARKACVEAIEFTLSSISLVQQRKDDRMSRRLVTSWPIETGTEFHALLTERRPVSLVILAYYAVLLKLGTGLWWIGKWPEALLNHISAILGEEWAEFLKWPKMIVLDSATEATTAPDSSTPKA
jgi:hypothetical protein